MAGIPLLTEEQFLKAKQQIDTEITNISESVEKVETDFAQHLDNDNETAHGINNIAGLQSELNKKSNKVFETYHSLPLINGWTGHIHFSKNDMGIVHVRFNLGTGIVAVGTGIGNMPVGYRPYDPIYAIVHKANVPPYDGQIGLKFLGEGTGVIELSSPLASSLTANAPNAALRGEIFYRATT